MPPPYSLVFTFGLSCAAPQQLRCYGLRAFSSPMDWMAFISPTACDALLAFIRSGFDWSFLKRENLSLRNSDVDIHGNRTLYDRISEFGLGHHFKTFPVEETEFRTVMETLRRRSTRLKDLLSKAVGNCLIVCSLPPEVCTFMDARRYGASLLEAFRTTFPANTFDLAITAYDDAPAEAAEGEISLYHAPVDDTGIDVALPSVSAHWKWLSHISLTGATPPKAPKRLAYDRTRRLAFLFSATTVTRKEVSVGWIISYAKDASSSKKNDTPPPARALSDASLLEHKLLSWLRVAMALTPHVATVAVLRIPLLPPANPDHSGNDGCHVYPPRIGTRRACAIDARANSLGSITQVMTGPGANRCHERCMPL